MVARLYARWGLTDDRDLDDLTPRDFPILSDLYALMEEALRTTAGRRSLSIPPVSSRTRSWASTPCVWGRRAGSSTATPTLPPPVPGLRRHSIQQASKNVWDAAMFNILSYMSHQLLHQGNAAAVLDELTSF